VKFKHNNNNPLSFTLQNLMSCELKNIPSVVEIIKFEHMVSQNIPQKFERRIEWESLVHGNSKMVSQNIFRYFTLTLSNGG
jgi:hypothetical protein